MKLNCARIHDLGAILIAGVWLVNGLVCKVMGLVPRHEQIVAGILGVAIAKPLTIFIGCMEILMSVWVLTKIKSKWSAVLQIVLVGLMNVLEFVLVPEQLLWGKYNALFALLFMAFVYVHAFGFPRQAA
jgi:hypothetical protein